MSSNPQFSAVLIDYLHQLSDLCLDAAKSVRDARGPFSPGRLQCCLFHVTQAHSDLVTVLSLTDGDTEPAESS